MSSDLAESKTMTMGKDYEIIARGVNNQGNRWDSRDCGPGHAKQNPYHYSNKDGSYYYHNSDGSRYYNDGQGWSWYEPPTKQLNNTVSDQTDGLYKAATSEEAEMIRSGLSADWYKQEQISSDDTTPSNTTGSTEYTSSSNEHETSTGSEDWSNDDADSYEDSPETGYEGCGSHEYEGYGEEEIEDLAYDYDQGDDGY